MWISYVYPLYYRYLVSIPLRRSAANEFLFKLFFLHPFLASKIHYNTFKTKSNIG